MEKHFDPYHKWLGIPPAEQPPDLYRLLGVAQFEHDPDVIANAADQRMAHLRTFQTGQNAALSQQLLNQLAAARVVLLHAEKRVQYDAQLRGELEAKAAQAREPKPPPARQGRPPAAPPRASSPEPSTSDRLNALFENLSVEEKAVLGKVRRSLGRAKDERAGHGEPLDPQARQRRRQLAVGALVAGAVAVGVVLLSVVLAGRRMATETAGAQGPVETSDEVGSPADRELETDRRQRDAEAVEPSLAATAVLILRWPESERAGAQFTIDGLRVAPINTSPAHLEFKLPPGEHRVRILRDHYVPFDETVSLEIGAKVDRTVVWQPVVQSDGTGLWAEYFNGRDCRQLIFRRIDPNVQFIWGDGSPDERVPADEFSARWTGYLKAPVSGRYKLRAIIDDFMQVWIDGNMVLWGAGGAKTHPEVEVELTGRPQSIKIEFWEGNTNAVACLNWLPPGDFVEQAVPSEAFFTEKAVAEKTPVPESILRPAPSKDPPALVVGQPVDVLQRIDPDRHAIQGRWWFDGSSLICCRGEASLVELPCPLPEEYEVRMTVERLDGRDALGLTMTAAGRTFTVVLNGVSRGTPISGVELIDGNRFDRTETLQTGWGFVNQQSHEIHCMVRESRLVVHADSETVIDWDADYRRCGIFGQWFAERVVPFNLGTWNSRFRISKLQLIPLGASDGEGGDKSTRVNLAQHGGDATGGKGGAESSSPQTLAQKRIAAPSITALDAKQAEIRKLLSNEYTDKSKTGKLALAGRLLSLASESRQQDAATAYCLLREAQQAATDAREPGVAFRAVDEAARQFEIDVVSEKADSLAAMISGASADEAKAIILAFIGLVGESTSSQDIAAVSKRLPSMIVLARRTGDRELGRSLGHWAHRLRDMTKICNDAESALEVLHQGEATPEHHTTIGTYCCFVLGDWNQGFEHFLQSDDAELRDLATRASANPTDPGDQLQLADAWWELGDKVPEVLADKVKAEAAVWYRKALPQLAGLELLRVKNRLGLAESSDQPADVETLRLAKEAPFWVNLDGLAGAPGYLPEKAPPAWRTTGAFARIFGKGEIAYPTVPACWYVIEAEIEVMSEDASLSINYLRGGLGIGNSIDIHFDKDKGKTICSFPLHRQGVWHSNREYDKGERLRLKLVAADGRIALVDDAKDSQRHGYWPSYLGLRIRSHNDNTQAIIHRLAVRPLRSDDVAEFGWPMPSAHLDLRPEETALRVKERTGHLESDPHEGKPFCVRSTGTEMRWISPGRFKMGSTRDLWWENEYQHDVQISRGFWIGACEVTQGEWLGLIGANPSVITGSSYLPVTWVSWEDAMRFCERLTLEEHKARRLPSGYVYRLPTEAEWEYACRAGNSGDFSIDRSGMWCDSTSDGRPHEAGMSEPNAWGVYDMHGNVAEWCLDAWGGARKDTQLYVDPFKKGDPARSSFVIRGGAYYSSAGDCRSAKRDGSRSAPHGHHGFRIVLGPMAQ